VFVSTEIYLVRERNERLLQEITADRLGGRPRENRGGGPRRTSRIPQPRRFTLPFGRPGRADVRGGA
jgi:hypothetical protein